MPSSQPAVTNGNTVLIESDAHVSYSQFSRLQKGVCCGQFQLKLVWMHSNLYSNGRHNIHNGKNVWPSCCFPLITANCLLFQRKWCQALWSRWQSLPHTEDSLMGSLTLHTHTHTILYFPCIILDSAYHNSSCNITPLSTKEVVSDQRGSVAIYTQWAVCGM